MLLVTLLHHYPPLVFGSLRGDTQAQVEAALSQLKNHLIWEETLPRIPPSMVLVSGRRRTRQCTSNIMTSGLL
jgi:hypothetical protein